MADDLAKQIEAEEKLYSTKVADLLTKHLNSKKIKDKADELSGASGKWPPTYDSDMIAMLDDAMQAEWKRIKRDYSAFKEKLTLETKKGKPPAVTAELAYDGSWKGGKSTSIETGDSLAKIAKREYGFSTYAAAIADANSDLLGSSCKVLPAGFGLELPKIWVPNWQEEPKAKQPSFSEAKAEEVTELPGFAIALSTKGSVPVTVKAGPVILEITITLAGEVTLQPKGKVDATFDAAKKSGSIKKALGPLSGEYEIDCTSRKGSSTLALEVFNKKVGGLGLKGSVKLASGKLSMNLEAATTKIDTEDWTGTAKLKGKAELTVKPNPDWEEPPDDPYEASVAANLVVVAAVTVVFAGAVARVLPAAGAAAARYGKGVVDSVQSLIKGVQQAVPAM